MGQAESLPVGRTPSYIPSINKFPINDDSAVSADKKKTKVVVIGSGCAGLAAAYHLHKVGMSVKLFESGSKLGGHANTIKGNNTHANQN